MAPTLHTTRTTVIVFSAAALLLAVQAPASDCDGNGVDDAADVQPSGPGYRLMRKLELPAGVADVALADMNGDGLVDVTAVSHASGEVFVALGQSAWSWHESSRTVTEPENDLLLVEDLDRDGHPDAVIAGPEGLSFLFNGGNGVLDRVPGLDVPIGSKLSDVEIVDVDADGWSDVVTWNRLRNVSIVRNARGRRFDFARNYASGIQPHSRADTLAAGDLDRDGYIDLALASGTRIAVLWNDGLDGHLEPSIRTFPYSEIRMLGYADVDADGNGDLLLSSGGVLVSMKNEGGRVLTEELYPSGIVHTPLLLDDLDLDGRPEITSTRWGCEGFIILSMNAGAYAESMSFPVQRSQNGVLRAADLDGDGDKEIAVFEPRFTAIRVYSRETAFPRKDCNENGIPDGCEEDDCNENGIPDGCDIATGEAEDCDGNGIPDECDPDCNTNRIPDGCEIRDGKTADCDGNGRPDTCDFPDANHNGVPDGCEVMAGTGRDCNGNGVLDELETAPGLPSQKVMAMRFGSHLESADLDGDGSPEVLITTPGGAIDIHVLKSVSGSSPVFVSMGIGTTGRISTGESVAAIDFDADGDLDLALLAHTATCNSRMGLGLVENLGELGFRFGRWHVFSRLFPDSILAGDFDGDAKPDVIAWGSGWYLWLLRGIPGGLDEPRLLLLDQGIEFQDIASSDLDGDGDLDLVTDTGVTFANPGNGALFYNGLLPPPRGSGFLGVMDFGADGDDDILTGGLLVENQGPWVFVQKTITTENVSKGAVGDIDGDGREDAVLALHDGLGLYLQRAGAFEETLHGQVGITSIATVDVSRDGLVDLAMLSETGVFVHVNTAGRPLASFGKRLGDVAQVTALEAADVDRDGDLDLASASNEFRLWLNDGRGSLIADAPVPLGTAMFARGLAARDMDGDGDVDFIVPTTGRFILLERGAEGQLSHLDPDVELLTIPLQAIALDVDQDGREDLAIQSEAGQVFVLFGSGWPRFDVEPVVLAVSLGRGISSGDLDGDGDPDLVAMRKAGILPITNEKGRSFTLGQRVELVGEPESSVLGDLDGDGDLDLVASHCDPGTECEDGALITLLRNDGSAVFGDPVSRRVSHHAGELEAADLNDDGEMDLVVSAGMSFGHDVLRAGDSVEVFINGGRGELHGRGSLTVGVVPGPISIGDFNGEAGPDLALGSIAGLAVFPLSMLSPRESDADGDGVLDSCGSVPFRRGDWNSDGRLDLTDAVALLGRLFLGGDATGCDDAGDSDDNGKLDLADPLRILRHLFQGDPPLPAPDLDCGDDPTADGLSCVVDRSC